MFEAGTLIRLQQWTENGKLFIDVSPQHIVTPEEVAQLFSEDELIYLRRRLKNGHK